MVNGGGSSELKIHVLKDLKAQQTMAGMSPVSGGVLPVSVSTGSSSSSVVAAAAAAAAASSPMWNNLFDLSGIKSADTGSDLVASSASIADSSSTTVSTINTSTTCSSIGNTNNNNSNEDSYEAGIADDMRELALRLESELELNDKGA